MGRKKRAIKYKCKKTKEVILGVMFYDLYHKDGIKARKCCCTPYKGELYSFNVTVDQSWIEILEDKRSNTFRDWKKMVEQEVIYLIRNDEYSELVTTDLLQNITFVGFFKSKSQKVGVEFQVHLNEPHWDNPQRIERAWEELMYIYRNQSSDEKTVLGHSVYGRYTKRD